MWALRIYSYCAFDPTDFFARIVTLCFCGIGSFNTLRNSHKRYATLGILWVRHARYSLLLTEFTIISRIKV